MLFTNNLLFDPTSVGGVAALTSSSTNSFDITGSFINQTVMTVPGYFDSALILLNLDVTTPDTIITLWKNGSATTIVVDITNGSSGAGDYSDTIYVAQGDSIQWVLTSTGDTGIMNICVRFTES